MEAATGPSRIEMLAVAEAVAREKSIEREEVLEAMELAIQKAGRSKYGAEHDIRVRIDRNTGDIHLYRYREVVEEIEDEHTQLTLPHARLEKADAELGEFLVDELPPIDFGRIAAQTSKQVIVQRVRDAERERQFEEYKDRVGEIINGLVKRVEYGNVTVDLGRGEAVLRRDEMIPRETFRTGDRVRAYIYDVRREVRGPQILLTRSRPEFMRSLFAQEVPEIYDSIIEIRAAARDPGSRAKIAVISNDGSIDPVGACVGMRGSRVQAVVGEMQGEKIDIIPWSDDTATFVVNALAPAEVSKVIIDEDTHKIEVVVAEDQLSLAIGRRGQNVRLATMLTGWDIDLMTEDEESRRRQEEFQAGSQRLIDALDVEDVIAHLLVTEGFTSIEEVAFVPAENLSNIEGFDEDIAEELQTRARAWLEERDQRLEGERRNLGVTDDIAAIEGMTPAMSLRVGEAGVKTLDDLGDLTADELRFMVMTEETGNSLDDLAQMQPEDAEKLLEPSELSEAEANTIIMSARQHWFDDEPATTTQSNAETTTQDTAQTEADPAQTDADPTQGEAE
ncbi:MAG: transcription termination factor NusA [Alphaproteobacteria bacterium]